MKLRVIAGLLVAFFLSAGVAIGAGSLEEHMKKGAELYKKKDYQGAIVEFDQAVEVLKKSGDLANAQKIKGNVAKLLFKLEEYDKAAAAFEEALALYNKPDPKVDLDLRKNLALCHQRLGRYALRASIIEELLTKYEKLDDKDKALLLAQLGDSYRRNEIHSKAVAAYQAALDLYVKTNDLERQAMILTAMSQSQVKLGQFDEAIKSLTTALPLAERSKEPRNLAETNSNMGIVHWDMGEYGPALDFVTKAQAVEKKMNLTENLAADYNNEGLIYKSVGDYPKALASIETAVNLARDNKFPRREAIALSNRALVRRILGQDDEAQADYEAALKIYETEKFREGQASCYLGLGKLYEVSKQDYKKAYELYNQALEIYTELDNTAYRAEALNQIGRVLKKGIDPARSSRDLIFVDDEPVFIDLEPDKAREESLKAYTQALELAQKANKREAIWTAHQGIGFAQRTGGQLEQAYKSYDDAIGVVLGIRSGGDRDLMGDYLKDKEDLFTEAMETALDMYTKTQNKKYLKQQMLWQEIYKNEVMKGAMNSAGVEYEDPDKAGLMKELQKQMAQKEKLDQLSADQQNTLSKKPEGEADQADLKKKQQDAAAENKIVQTEAKKLDKSIEELLKEWKQKYPADSGMFDSSAEVDINAIQKALDQDQILIQYFPLKDKLSILAVTQKEIKNAEVEITYEKLASLIRDKFTYEVIELYGHSKTDLSEPEAEKLANDVLHELYNILVKPVAAEIEGKKQLIIVPSKYIGYVPFAALVSGFEGGQPKYLVFDYTISYIRLSFFKNVFGRARSRLAFSKNKLLAVGNPTHRYLKAGLPDLPGAEKEVQNAVDVAREKKIPDIDVVMRGEATETAWREKLANNPPSIFYFATHGVPYAEILYDRKATIGPYLEKLKDRVKKTSDAGKKQKYEQTVKALEEFESFCDATFRSKSPLNGFLYMAYSGQEKDDGVLTLREIIEMPEEYFKNANLAILSACNTAVTYSPKVDPETRKATQTAEVDKELASAGFTPGVDQVALADTFMKRNFISVMGTLWFADDAATAYIIGRFFENLEGHTSAEALRLAQLDYLNNPPLKPDYTKVPRHPYFWAVSAIFGE